MGDDSRTTWTTTPFLEGYVVTRRTNATTDTTISYGEHAGLAGPRHVAQVFGILDLVDGEKEIAPGVKVVPTPGHTRHHQSVLVENRSAPPLLFLGDVVPTSIHVKLPFIMAYDLDVVATLESKRKVLGRAIDEQWIVAFGHDAEIKAAHLRYDDKGQVAITDTVAI